MESEVDIYAERQDKFMALMIEAYNQHRIPNWYVFKPYFDWKISKMFRIKLSEIREMRSVAHRLLEKYDQQYPNSMDGIDFNDTDDLFCYYRGYGKDAETVGLLTGIEEELTNIMIMRYER